MDILSPWLPAIAILAAFLLIRIVFCTVILRFLKTFAQKLPFATSEDVVSAVSGPVHFLLLVAGVYFALLASPVSHMAQFSPVKSFVRSCVLFSFFWTCFNLTTNAHNLLSSLLGHFGLVLEESLANIVSAFVRFFIVAIAIAMIVSEWGYDINGFIAGLSLGGLAISLAAKDALANVFGSIVIIMDKPFTIGDWIMANGIEGTVEKISLRSTSLRTFPQALVYVPNSLLSNTPIVNYSKRAKRRIDFTLGVTYSTTPAQMEACVQSIRNFLNGHEGLYKEDMTVTFDSFGASSLNVFVICYSKTTNYLEFLRLKEEINFALLDILSANGVSPAFPSTSVYFENALLTRPANPESISKNS